MTQSKRNYRIDDATINKLDLTLSAKHINAQIAPAARVFEYPQLENVFIMESDLYGNVMPEDSCFLAFTGHHGLMGKHMTLEALHNSSVESVRNMVQCNQEG